MPTKVEVETNTEVLIDIWNQIIGPDRVNLEVTHAEEALLTLAKEKCDSVLHLLLKLSHTDVLRQLAYIQAALLEGMGRTRLRIYRESWCKQGHVETSESLDAIWEYGLVPLFDWCRENIDRLLKKQMMYGKLPMTNLVRTGMGFFDEKANEFRKRLEEEFKIAKPFQARAAKLEDKPKPKTQYTPRARTIIPIPPLEKLKEQKSLAQIQAAKVFRVEPRTIRYRVKAGRLTQTSAARIVTTDAKFEKEYNLTHSPRPK